MEGRIEESSDIGEHSVERGSIVVRILPFGSIAQPYQECLNDLRRAFLAQRMRDEASRQPARTGDHATALDAGGSDIRDEYLSDSGLILSIPLSIMENSAHIVSRASEERDSRAHGQPLTLARQDEASRLMQTEDRAVTALDVFDAEEWRALPLLSMPYPYQSSPTISLLPSMSPPQSPLPNLSNYTDGSAEEGIEVAVVPVVPVASIDLAAEVYLGS